MCSGDENAHRCEGLCGCCGRQFLPQDKVASFAQLRPGELLIETERAIGDSSLHTLHLALIDARTELRRLESVRAHLPPFLHFQSR